jgi:uncharacterized protein YjbI with pentapeptide repeats
MADKDKKIDPFDVEALEKSLNDSATRVSTIWVSFLIFSLYLLTAAATVTHRQLFLAEPVKLPVLNIDLPLWGFFFLAPILFVIFHAYVLIQVILLARTAAAYNETLDRTIHVASDNARVRQRLANTLFAQVFAGSPEERTGILGSLLLTTAWITLTVLPVFVLLVFELKFLPYQSNALTWFHRVLITSDLLFVLGTWPIILDPRASMNLSRTFKQKYILTLTISALVIPYFILSFPGEFHTTWIRHLGGDQHSPGLEPVRALECNLPWWLRGPLPREFDRLILPYEQVGSPTQSGSTAPRRNLRSRNFACAIFNYASFRDLDFTEANLTGANLRGVETQNTGFDAANIQSASFYQSRLENASFRHARGQGAIFEMARLWGADFTYAELTDSNFKSTQLHGSTLTAANLLGADLTEARLIAVALRGSSLVGANLSKAQLIGANISEAQIHATDLRGANLEAADLSDASLQGSLLDEANLRLADFTRAKLWNSSIKQCDEAFVHQPNLHNRLILPSIKVIYDSESHLRNSDTIGYRIASGTLDFYISEAIKNIALKRRDALAKVLRERLTFEATTSDQIAWAKSWIECAQRNHSEAEFGTIARSRLVKLACDAELRNHVLSGIYSGWIASDRLLPQFGRLASERKEADQRKQERGRLLARALLELDERSCAPSAPVNSQIKARLREIAGE